MMSDDLFKMEAQEDAGVVLQTWVEKLKTLPRCVEINELSAQIFNIWYAHPPSPVDHLLTEGVQDIRKQSRPGYMELAQNLSSLDPVQVVATRRNRLPREPALVLGSVLAPGPPHQCISIHPDTWPARAPHPAGRLRGPLSALREMVFAHERVQSVSRDAGPIRAPGGGGARRVHGGGQGDLLAALLPRHQADRWAGRTDSRDTCRPGPEEYIHHDECEEAVAAGIENRAGRDGWLGEDREQSRSGARLGAAIYRAGCGYADRAARTGHHRERGAL